MLHPLAQDGVLRITAGFDRDALADFYVHFFDAIRDLDAVASRTRRRPASQDDIDRLDLPLRVGRVALRRPSVGGLNWLAQCAAPWWGVSKRAYTFAMAYVMAHREQGAVEKLYRRSYASTAILWWALRVGASEEALRRACLALLPPPDDSLRWFSDPDDQAQNNATAPDLGAIALSLSKTYGGTPAHWLWEVADEDFWRSVCDMQDARDAEADAASLSKGNGHADDTWWMRQRKALRDCEMALEADAKAWMAERMKKQEAANG